MNLPAASNPITRTNLTRQAMFGGAFIDAQGREIAITESMIQRACHDLARHYVAAQKKA
ncbi:MAG: hypothetical protein K2Y25_01075 [Pseudomonadaceae bacterium]|jgi:hypothetical protein|nr:hypothetical protein [Pseudomonadaceae bacterium]